MTDETDLPPITQLKPRQRRVLGVLVEKAFTTPEYYPMTLKALTAGCNQKSNRDPVSQYSEDDVEEAIEQLRELGLAATVHTESGRTERFRHYMRRRFSMSEPQLAILTELLLRGRQQLGELRSRAGRMVPIESLDQLRNELSGLIDLDLAQSAGDLNRRGVEVDHALYSDRERDQNTLSASGDSQDHPDKPTTDVSRPSVVDRKQIPSDSTVDSLREENRELREQIAQLQSCVDELRVDISDLKRDLGV